MSRPHDFTFAMASGCNQSSCQSAKEALRGRALPFAASPAAGCSLGRSAAQASCSRNLSKLDLRRGVP
ncbi:hypothetical protein HDV64DRAFT_244786 [Trichoderma sp. TUCIM 5745]